MIAADPMTSTSVAAQHKVSSVYIVWGNLAEQSVARSCSVDYAPAGTIEPVSLAC